jgi:predicted nucleic acid-binding Zn ribbon protein
MPRPAPQPDEQDEDQRDLPLKSDMDPESDDDSLPTDECPYCKKMIHEQAEWCHHCGQYLSREDQPRSVPLWLILTTAALLLAMAWGLLGR